MKKKLLHIRTRSDKVLTTQQKILRILFVLLLGAGLGFMDKHLDGTGSVVNQIGSEFGFWVALTTIIAAWSRSPRAAAFHACVFLIAMLTVYYLYSMVLFGFFPRYYFIAWGSIALLSSLGGYFVWYARGNGWIAAVCAALPISLLVVKGYSFLYTFSTPQGFDLLAAVLLFIFLPKEGVQRLRILPVVVGLFFIMERLGVVYFFPA